MAKPWTKYGINKADYQYLKQIANRLPVVYMTRDDGEFVDHIFSRRGKAMAESETRDVLRPTKTYASSLQTPPSINHCKRLVKAYSERGIKGVKAYVAWAESENIKQQQKLSNDKEKPKHPDNNKGASGKF